METEDRAGSQRSSHPTPAPPTLLAGLKRRGGRVGRRNGPGQRCGPSSWPRKATHHHFSILTDSNLDNQPWEHCRPPSHWAWKLPHSPWWTSC